MFWLFGWFFVCFLVWRFVLFRSGLLMDLLHNHVVRVYKYSLRKGALSLLFKKHISGSTRFEISYIKCQPVPSFVFNGRKYTPIDLRHRNISQQWKLTWGSRREWSAKGSLLHSKILKLLPLLTTLSGFSCNFLSQIELLALVAKYYSYIVSEGMPGHMLIILLVIWRL